jgi:hypothetical protein
MPLYYTMPRKSSGAMYAGVPCAPLVVLASATKKNKKKELKKE